MRTTLQIMRPFFQVVGALILVGVMNSAVAQDVSIPDSGLDAAIRDALQKPRGPLTAQDLLRLTNLNACCRSISSVAGIETARNLISLDLSKNSLADFTLPLGLTNLAVLILGGNQLTNLTLPAELTHLAFLDLSRNQLTSPTLPPGLTNLVELDLSANQLSTFTFPSSLTNLSELDLSGNQLSTLTLPPDVMQLTNLDLTLNPLTILALSEPLASVNLAETVASLRDQGVFVSSYPRTSQLISPRRTEDGEFTFAVIGPPGVYAVLGSVDFSTWSELGALTNDFGVARFSDTGAALSPHKFYRVRH